MYHRKDDTIADIVDKMLSVLHTEFVSKSCNDILSIQYCCELFFFLYDHPIRVRSRLCMLVEFRTSTPVRVLVCAFSFLSLILWRATSPSACPSQRPTETDIHSPNHTQPDHNAYFYILPSTCYLRLMW